MPQPGYSGPGRPTTSLIPPARTDGRQPLIERQPGADSRRLRRLRELPDRPIPTMGWQYWQYQLMKLIGLAHRVPRLSVREQRQRETEQREIEERRLTLDTIVKLRDRTVRAPRATVVLINAKGAAATTTTAVWTATVVAEITRRSLIVLDANPASGTSAARLGMDAGKTITIQQLHALIQSGPLSFADFISKVTPSRYSVRSVSANSIIEDNSELDAGQYREVLDVVSGNCEYLLVDTANNIVDPVTLEVVAASDVLVFTANVEVHDSLRQLATTMETLRRRGHEDKVNNGVVVISNLPDKAKLEDYRKYVNQTDLRDEVVQKFPFEGPFLAVPHDDFIARDGIVDLSLIQPATLQAYRELAIAILDQAVRPAQSADATSDS